VDRIFASHKVVESTGMVPTDPDVLAAVRHTARILERMGHAVEEARLPESDFGEFLPIWQRLIGGIPLMRWRRAQPVTAWLREGARGLKRAEVDALEDRLIDRYAPVFGTADLWLTPTVAVGPPPIGAWAGLPPADAFARAATLAAFTAVVNLVGLPAASIPAGISPHGLPIGVQLIGAMFRESDVLSVSWDLEEAMAWRQLAPG
jgi:amidase